MNGVTLPEQLNFDFNRCILLVDDERNHRMLLTYMLRDIGFSRFMLAKNGLEALEVYREHRDIISLVISDIKMPKMNGVELFQELSKEKEMVPMIICSGTPDLGVVRQMRLDGLKGFLQKPYSVPELVSTLKDAFSVPVGVDATQRIQMAI